MKQALKHMYNSLSKQFDRKSKRFAHLEEQDIYIHPDSYLGRYTNIGRGTNINGPAHIESREHGPVTIGKYCAIAHNLRIRSRNHYTGFANLQDKFQKRHGFPSLDAIKGPVSIGNNVWIGDNVLILSGVTIGDGAIIGAGSIVTKSIPSYTVAVGNPAKIIRKRFCESTIQQLKEIRWWDWSEEKIARNRQFFETDFDRANEVNLSNIIVN